MPLYEYECTSCQTRVEIVQKFSDAPLTACLAGECKGELKRVFGSTSFQLKGTGFYSTDYKKK